MENNDNSDTFFQEGYGIGPFQMMNEIGKGQFGKVYIGLHGETKEKVAIKQIPKTDKNININLIKAEINIQKKLFHPYLCKMYCVIENPDYMFIVTEYCSGGEIFQKLVDQDAPFEEKTACKIFSQVLSGIEYLHNNYICHRDIKLENMLFDEYGDAKLTDFGLSKSFEGDITFDKAVGSAMYSAPEVFKRQPYIGRIADIWSLGICLYVMVCGEYPFKGDDVKDFIAHLFKDSFDVPETVTPEFKDLVYKILEKNPNNRLTIEQIKEHKWMHMFEFNYMKSPGIIINKDILPIDVNLIKELVGYNETKIRNLISDILTNKHNNNTILYYLKVESLKRKNGPSVSDIRPSSELFLNYARDEKSKMIYYENNINKKIDELVKYIINEFKMEELKIRENIKNSLNIGKNKNEKKENNNDNINDNKNDNNIKVNTKIKNKKFNVLLSKTYRNLEDFKEILKKIDDEEKKLEKEKKEENTKKNKLELLNQYIGPLLFIHDLIDDIITKVVKLKNKKEIKRTFIPVNNSSLNVLSTKRETILEPIKTENHHIAVSPFKNNIIKKYNNFSIDTIEEIEFLPTSNNLDKTFTFGFYKPINKNNKNKNTIEAERKTNKKNEKEITKKKKLNYTFVEYKKERPINIVKNNLKKFDKKKLFTHVPKNKSDISSIFNNSNFPKIIKEFKDKIEKNGILKRNKKTKRSSSQKKIQKIIYKLDDEEEINKIIKEKNRNKSEKILIKKKNKEKKQKTKEINYSKTYIPKNERILLSRRIKRNSKNKNKNLEENLNINEIISEKRSNKKNLNNTQIPKNEKKSFSHRRNLNSSQIELKNEKSLDNITNTGRKRTNTITIENSHQKTKNRKLLIIRNKNKSKVTINDENNINKKTHQRTQTTPVKMLENLKKNREIKSTIFPYKKNQKLTCQTGRNQRKPELSEKNISTNDSSVKKQIDPVDKNLKFKSIKSSSISLKRSLLKKSDEKNDNNKKDVKQNEIKTKKNENLIKNIITDSIGNNNTTISNISKGHTRFSCKMYIGKKKLVFNLNLIQKEKNKNMITGEFLDGDIKSYEKLFEQIKVKLE